MKIKPMVAAVRSALCSAGHGLSVYRSGSVFDAEHPCDSELRVHMERVDRLRFQQAALDFFNCTFDESVRFVPRPLGKSIAARLAMEEAKRRGLTMRAFNAAVDRPSARATVHNMWINELFNMERDGHGIARGL